MHVGLIIHNDEWANHKEVKDHIFHQGWHQNCPTVLLRRPCAEESELLYLSHDLFSRSTAESILSSTSFWFGNSTAVQNLNRIMRTAGEIICVLLPLLQDIYPELLAQSLQHPQGPQTSFAWQVYTQEKYRNTKDCSGLSSCQSAKNKLKCLYLLIFNYSICLHPVLKYLLV